MKFTISEKGHLTIVDDKKTIILETDKYDLIDLKEKIEDYLNDKSENKGSFGGYGFNPRTKRLEPIIK